MKTTWLRPKTTRVYLHPPKAERMFTLWREGKIILSENIRGVDSHSYKELECVGLWPVFTKYARAFDFRRNEYVMQPDGTPIHGLTMGFGGFEVQTEAFCTAERRPSCLVRYRITNTAPTPAKEQFGFVVRRGNEKKLVSGSPDEYCSHCPEVAAFLYAPQSFTYHDSSLSDGEYAVHIDSPLSFALNEELGTLMTTVALAPGESVEITLQFSHADAPLRSYEEERAAVRSYWQSELARLTKLPRSVKEDPQKLAIVQNLTVQILQCFCHYVGEELLIPRQGGLQKLIWQWEAIPMLEALHTVGDFKDYLFPVFSLYFDTLQTPEGEVRPIGENWANITGSALYTIARYCYQAEDEAAWKQYRSKALKAMDWIRKKRLSSAEIPGAVAGIFPPMRACDWGEEYQAWVNTDICNLRALKALTLCAERFDDPAKEQIRAEWQSLLSVIKRIYRPFSEAARHSDVLRLPLTADGNDQWLLDAFHPTLYHSRVVDSDVVPDGDVEKIRRWMKENGLAKNGLYGHMPYPDGNTHIWYTNNPEYHWFMKDLALGKRDSALEILKAQLDYSMTDEYYMVERFSDVDPWYVPWSPNASASGRLILMLCAL